MRVTLKDLIPGIPYTVQFQAVAADGRMSEWSRSFYLTPMGDAFAPLTPTGLAVTMDGTTFKTSWNAVTTSSDNSMATDLKGYVLKVFAPALAQTVYVRTTATLLNFTLADNTAYFGQAVPALQFSVAAEDTFGNISPYSTVVAATNPAPAQPTNFVGTPLQDAIQMSWAAVADTDLLEYRIHHGTTVGFAPSGANMVFAGKVLTAVHANSVYGSDSYYKLAAIDAFGQASTYASIGPIRPLSPFTVDTTAPAVPTGLAATISTPSDYSSATMAVTWSAVADTDLDRYVIAYRAVGDTTWSSTSAEAGETSRAITVLPFKNYEVKIRAIDWQANESAYSSVVTTTTATTNTAPSTPAAPTASSSTMQIQVSHNGLKAAGGAMEADVRFYEVYASTTAGFTASSANRLGEMEAGPAISGVWYLPVSAASQTWYVRVIAVDGGGLKSTASAEGTATPGLIGTANIADATITNAKITALDANKIQAGTGFINDLTVKSKFTLGDASTTGAIESFGYVAGTTGFRFDKTLLEINQGSIAAAALKIQDSQNLTPPQFTSFDFTPAFYASGSNLMQPANTTITIPASGGKYSAQYLQIRSTTAASFGLYLGNSLTDYNTALENGSVYIYSAWLKTGSVASTVRLRVKNSAGTLTDVATVNLPASGSWQRVNGTYTATANSDVELLLTVDTATIGAGVDIDGVQIERQQGAITTPSPFKPSSFTRIDAGIIRTGELRSTTTTTVNGASQPNWSINVSGNAQFGDALVRGKLLVGTTGDPDAGQSFISSGNFVTGTTGWKIDSSGYTEFNSGIYRGTLGAGIVNTNALAAEAVNASKIAAKTITSQQLSLGTYPSTVPDGSFEEEVAFGALGTEATDFTRWVIISKPGAATLERKRGGFPARSGLGAALIYNGEQGVATGLMSAPFPVTPNSKVMVSTSAVTVGGETSKITLKLYTGATPSTATNVITTTITDINVDKGTGVIDFEDYALGAVPTDGVAGDAWQGGAFGATSPSAVNVVTTQAKYGTKSLEVTWAASTGQENTFEKHYWGLIPGNTYTVWAWVYVPAGSPTVQFRDIYNNAGNSSTVTNAWQLLWVTFTANTTDHYIGVTTVTGGNVTAGTKVYFDGWSDTMMLHAEDYKQYIAEPITVPVGHNWARLVIQSSNGVTGRSFQAIDDASVTVQGQYTADLSAAGLRLIGADGSETAAFVSNRPNYLTINNENGTVAHISKEGSAFVQSLIVNVSAPTFDSSGQMTSGMMVYGKEFTKWLDDATGMRPVAYGTRDTANTAASAETPYMQLDAPNAVYGRTYVIKATGHAQNNTSGSRAYMKIRYTTDGTAPVITSTLLRSWRTHPAWAANSVMPFVLEKSISFPASPTNPAGTPVDLRTIITVGTDVGSSGNSNIVGSATDPFEMWIFDAGPFLGDTGIDRTAASPPASKGTYTKTYAMTASKSYRADGTGISGTVQVLQGDDALSGNTNRRGLWIMSTQMGIDVSAAVVSKVEVYAYANYWWMEGGVGRIHVHNFSTIPSTLPTSSTAYTFVVESGQNTGNAADLWPKPGGRWVTLPNNSITISGVTDTLHNHMRDGRIKGFGMGPYVANARTYIGKFNSGDAKMRVTYTK